MSRTASIQASGRSTRNHGERGFALIEILVAFAILALGLGVIVTGVAIAMRSDGHIQTSRAAIRLAQSRLEAAGISDALLAGQREGRTANNYKWRETITAVDNGAEPPQPRAVSPGQTAAGTGIRPFWVEIAVEAADGTVERLAGLKLGPAATQ